MTLQCTITADSQLGVHCTNSATMQTPMRFSGQSTMQGFTYCLDHEFATKDGEYPSQDVCIWGPDQLKSRLQSLYFLI